MRRLLALSICASSACSLVFSGDEYLGDAGLPVDAGPLPDAGRFDAAFDTGDAAPPVPIDVVVREAEVPLAGIMVTCTDAGGAVIDEEITESDGVATCSYPPGTRGVALVELDGVLRIATDVEPGSTVLIDRGLSTGTTHQGTFVVPADWPTHRAWASNGCETVDLGAITGLPKGTSPLEFDLRFSPACTPGGAGEVVFWTEPQGTETFGMFARWGPYVPEMREILLEGITPLTNGTVRLSGSLAVGDTVELEIAQLRGSGVLFRDAELGSPLANPTAAPRVLSYAGTARVFSASIVRNGAEPTDYAGVREVRLPDTSGPYMIAMADVPPGTITPPARGSLAGTIEVGWTASEFAPLADFAEVVVESDTDLISVLWAPGDATVVSVTLPPALAMYGGILERATVRLVERNTLDGYTAALTANRQLAHRVDERDRFMQRTVP